MGVLGLWKLLEPTARPIKLQGLEGKILAIDILLDLKINRLLTEYFIFL